MAKIFVLAALALSFGYGELALALICLIALLDIIRPKAPAQAQIITTEASKTLAVRSRPMPDHSARHRRSRSQHPYGWTND
jgi:hypothetical protein